MENLPINWNMIGQCYDVLYVSPFTLNSPEAFPNPGTRTGTKETNAFEMSESSPNLKYTPDTSTVYSTSQNTISASYDYLKKVSAAVSVSGDLAGFESSASAEWSQTIQNEFSQLNIVTLTEARRVVGTVNLLNETSDDPQEVPPLENGFKTALWDAGGDQTDISAFILQYGTHIANRITLGGIGYQQFHLSQENAAKMFEQDINVSAEAKNQLLEAEGSTSVHVSEEWKNAISGERTNIQYYGGGEATLDFSEWLSSVDSLPKVVGVNLLAHHALVTSGYFPEYDAQEVDARRDVIKERLEAYIRSNGRDLATSIIEPGDTVCLVPLPIPENVSENEVPFCLAQPLEDGATAQCAVTKPAAASWPAFLSNPDANATYFWTVSSGDQKTGSLPVPAALCLTNRDTMKALDSEGAREYWGYVSAGSGTTPVVDSNGHSSADWTLMSRLGSWGDASRPLNSGDVITIRRNYESPNADKDPQGYLQNRNDLVYSNGQNAAGIPFLKGGMAWLLVRSTQNE